MPSTALLPFAGRYFPPTRTLFRRLPGRAVSAVALVHGACWVIIDPDKTNTCTQVVQFLYWG